MLLIFLNSSMWNVAWIYSLVSRLFEGINFVLHLKVEYVYLCLRDSTKLKFPPMIHCTFKIRWLAIFCHSCNLDLVWLYPYILRILILILNIVLNVKNCVYLKMMKSCFWICDDFLKNLNLTMLLIRLLSRTKYITAFYNKEPFMKSNWIDLSRQSLYVNLCSCSSSISHLGCEFSIKSQSSIYFCIPSSSFLGN